MELSMNEETGKTLRHGIGFAALAILGSAAFISGINGAVAGVIFGGILTYLGIRK